MSTIQTGSLILAMLNFMFVLYSMKTNIIVKNISIKDEDFKEKIKEFWERSKIIDKAYYILGILSIIYILNIIYQAYIVFENKGGC